jgi:hypothetical protein
MGQRIPEQKHDPFQDFSDRRVVASVVWRRDVIVGIVVTRRRDGWSALLQVPERAQRPLAVGVNRCGVMNLWGSLRMAVQWALRDLQFEARGFSLDPRLNGEEPAQCGSLRAFGDDFIGVDIGEFETPDVKRLN